MGGKAPLTMLTGTCCNFVLHFFVFASIFCYHCCYFQLTKNSPTL
jgi:hypothetical protein